jgi:DNA primase large subunit
MQAYGDCVNRDERCERITHPLSYYKTAVEASGGTDGTATVEAADGGDDR